MNELIAKTPSLPPVPAPGSGAGVHFCTFRLAGQLYGIELAAVREVSAGLVITPVPHATPEVRGLANLRSRIHLVLDLRPILGFAATETTRETRVVILKDRIAESVGILVDAGGDIVSTFAEAIEPTERAGGAAAERVPALVTGICKLPGELLMVVDPGRITDHVKGLLA